MPIYQYICECSHSFEEYRSISKGPRKTCPKCKAKEPIFHQDYANYKQVVNDGVIRTVGQQARVNAKRLGKEQLEKMEEEASATYKRRTGESIAKGGKKVKPVDDGTIPFWRPPDGKPLDITKIKDLKKYVATGEKD